MQQLYTLIILAILAVSSYISLVHYTGPSGDSVAKGYGRDKDSTAALLDRIQWANHYPARLNTAARHGVCAVIISFAAGVVYGPRSTPGSVLISVIIVWMVLAGAHSFFTHHSDKFSAFFIDDNLERVRRRLKVSSDVPGLRTHRVRFSRNHDCVNFTTRADFTVPAA